MTAPLYVGRSTPSLDLLINIAESLGPLVDRVVFIGGAIAPLLQTNPVSPRVRPTKDVDGIALTATYPAFGALQEQLRHVDAPTFIALKWAAFGDRGGGDLFASHDVEDILAVIASRPSLSDEYKEVPSLVRTVVSNMASTLLEDDDMLGELLHAHVVVTSENNLGVVHLEVEECLRRLTAQT